MNIMTAPSQAVSSTSLPTAKLDAMAVDFVQRNATEDSDFGTVDGNNCGLTAYSLSAGKSKALLSLARDIYPGAKELKKFQFNPSSQNLVAVVTSEDEPHIHLVPQSKASGACSPAIVGLNVVDLCSAQPELFEAACPGADPEDWGSAMTGIFAKERHLKLGEGSADASWWT
jgi:hypothetical protein